MNILVTGATGFLGQAIVRELLKRNIKVRALVRQSSSTECIEQSGVDIVVGSLNPAEGLEHAVVGIDAVIHSAGGGWARNVQGIYDNNSVTTENLLSALEDANPDIQRFVLVSSLSAHGPCPEDCPRDPDSPATPITHYGHAKAAAEASTLKRSALFPVTIIRPPAIYGPGDKRLLPLFKMVARGVAGIPGDGRTLSMIHVDDCARAICDLALKQHPIGRRYFVEDGCRMSHREMVMTIGRALGRNPFVFAIPRWLLWIAAIYTELISMIFKRPALLTRDKVKDLSQAHWVCDATPIKDELGWAPQHDFSQGTQQTAQWYYDNGWLK